MSWELFKQNILIKANNPQSIQDIDTVAKLWADEYDACMKRGGDTINKVAIKKGNKEIMQQLFKAVLLKGQSTNQPYDLVGEMGKGVLAYWQGAILNEFPIPLIPAPGATANIGVVSNIVTNPGTWQPAVSIPSLPAGLPPNEPSVEELLKKIPDDNNTVEGATEITEDTGVEVITDGGDDPGPQLQRVKNQLPKDRIRSEAEFAKIPETLSDNTTNNKDANPITCGSGLDYNAKISSNYRLRDLSIGCIFAHKIKAQRGLSEEDIVCNLQNVAINILEPLKKQFPNMRVNSGFRGTPSIPGGVSQHEKGEAVDVQFTGFSNKDYLNASNWVRENLPFDQFIFEHGNSIWFHISCKRNGGQRKQLLTMLNGKYESGIKLYYA